MTLAVNYSMIGNLLVVGGTEVNKVYQTKDFPTNIQALMLDKLGHRFFSFVHNRDTVDFIQGELVSKVGDANGLTAVANILSGSTVLAVTTGLTAGAHDGAIMFVLDNADAAGAAPEGEYCPIKRNTATRIELDTSENAGLTTALAVNDDLQLLATYGIEAAAAGDFANTVMGIVVAPDGLPIGKYGFTQCKGHCRGLMLASTALGVGVQIIAATKRFTITGAASAHRLMIGGALVTISSDIVSDMTLVDMRCGPWANSYSDVDALA
jgi:hypothetical protein